MADLTDALESLKKISEALWDIRHPPTGRELVKHNEAWLDRIKRWDNEEYRLTRMRQAKELKDSGLTFKQVGEAMGFSGGRAAQYYASAVQRLRKYGSLNSRPRPIVVTVG